MKRNKLYQVIDVDNVITTTNTSSVSLDGSESVSIQAVIDVNTPAAKSFATSDVNTTNDTITETAHGYVTGLKGQFTTTGTLPAGLSLATDYFVIRVDADTYKVATSLVNAQAGTAVDMTDVGSGTHTFTPTSIAGANWKVQVSNDDLNWVDKNSAQNITADVVQTFEYDRPAYRFIRAQFTLTAGMLSADLQVLIKTNQD